KPAIIELLKLAAPDAMGSVAIIDRRRPQPSALGQIRMWPLASAAGAGPAYNVQLVLALRGTLDLAALRGALDTLIARHEAWRTVFTTDGTHQTFAAPAGLPLGVTELTVLARIERGHAVLVHASGSDTRQSHL